MMTRPVNVDSPKSTFLTVAAWPFIIGAGFGTLMAVLQPMAWMQVHLSSKWRSSRRREFQMKSLRGCSRFATSFPSSHRHAMSAPPDIAADPATRPAAAGTRRLPQASRARIREPLHPSARPTALQHGGSMFARLVTCLIASVGLASAVMAAEIKVLAPNAAKEAVTEAISVFEKATGHKVSVSWSGTEAITKRVADGEVFDVVVNAAQNIDRQSKDGKLAAATRTDFAKSGIGVAVPSSAAKLDVSTVDALRTALLSARTVVVSSGTSGRHMVDVFAKLGVGERVKAKTRQPPSGAQIADFLAAGEADIGFQQISELLHAKGINYLGPVPAELQSYTIYSSAVHAARANADVAMALLAALRAPSTQAIVRASGMDPI